MKKTLSKSTIRGPQTGVFSLENHPVIIAQLGTNGHGVVVDTKDCYGLVGEFRHGNFVKGNRECVRDEISYEGSFVNGLQEGASIVTSKDGSTTTAYYHKGKLVGNTAADYARSLWGDK